MSKTITLYERNGETKQAKVGRKYYTLVGSGVRVDKKSLRVVVDYGERRKLFLSAQDRDEAVELTGLEAKLRLTFKMYGRTGLTLEQLRRIVGIIEEK